MWQRRMKPTSGNKVETKFGPSGLLKDDIANGAEADIFASANMAHPTACMMPARVARSTRFARNHIMRAGRGPA